RVRSADAAIASAQARVRVAEEALENTNVRAPFDGVVIKKRAEVGETVSPFGVAGQATREGGAIATIADLGELEVQTEVSENSVAGGGRQVGVVAGGAAARRPVTRGPERLDMIGVRSGVVPGDAVILNPPATLTDRAPVRVKGT